MWKEILKKVFSQTLLFYFQRNIISIWKKLSDHSALSRTNDPSHQQPKSVKKLGKPSMHNQEEKETLFAKLPKNTRFRKGFVDFLLVISDWNFVTENWELCGFECNSWIQGVFLHKRALFSHGWFCRTIVYPWDNENCVSQLKRYTGLCTM